MSPIPPQCLACRHLHKPGVSTCAAFPKGIPKKILANDGDHRKPWPGDGGVRFEQDPSSKLTISDFFP